MTLKPTPPVVGKICEYIDSVFSLQHTRPEDATEIADLIAEHDAAKDAEIERMRVELAEANTIIDKFPKTADGVVVAPGDEVWDADADRWLIVADFGLCCIADGEAVSCEIIDSHSTREASEKTKDGA
jgi:hypothetical protein